MRVSEKDVVHVAQLANLELTSDEQAAMVRDLNSILEHVDRLSELDTTNVPPMAVGFGASATGAAPGDMNSQPRDASREDVAQGLRESLPHVEALANAPDSDGTFFLVPKVIERG
jgi:aspartyl-tRNA(Asn)/glutamyl-tRNA(Gln) amidotransferase subunit C